MTSATLLLRQINPTFIQNGRVTSQAFRPTPKDKDLLSVYDGDLIAADLAWEHFTQNPKCHSVGVLAVSVDECKSLQLPTRPDPTPFPEHAVIDFSDLAKREIEKKAKVLKGNAESLGWLYQPPV
jgi:hypothetical protein